jgi:hypothetical protein
LSSDLLEDLSAEEMILIQVLLQANVELSTKSNAGGIIDFELKEIHDLIEGTKERVEGGLGAVLMKHTELSGLYSQR